MTTAGLLLLCAVLIFSSFPTNALIGLPDGVCSINSRYCKFEDNIVAVLVNIFTLDECRIACRDEEACSYFTYFGANYYPFSEACILFSDCNVLQYGYDCITQDINCSPLNNPCSSPAQSHLDDNLILVLPGLKNEGDCKSSCISEDKCSFYTYHSLFDMYYPGVCFLLSSLREPIRYCDHCMTGVDDCTSNGGCFLLAVGKNTTSTGLMITNWESATTVVAVGSCSLIVLAVGGGSRGDSDGGGGSGYVVWKEFPVSKSLMLDVTVGKKGYNSQVKVTYNSGGGSWGGGGTTLVEAPSGESPGSEDGGDGFCGGGGSGDYNFPGGNGGTDGGNGYPGFGDEPNLGGKGSGVKVSTIPIRGFQVSPGSGGKANGDNNRYGGGGGGVLIDGQGPGGVHEGDGQGYGAGGGAWIDGKPGVVIITFG